MTREVLQQDDQGRPTEIVYRETEADRARREMERREQAERGRAVAESMRRRPADS